MKTNNYTLKSSFANLVISLFLIILVAGIISCDSQQQTTESPAPAAPQLQAVEQASAPVRPATPQPVQQSTAPAAPAAEVTPAPASIIVPAGTRLLVTLDSEIDSRKHGVGHMFTVTLDTNLVVSGKTLATKGTKLYGRTISSKKGGILAGKSEIDLQLTDININDVPHPIVTSGIKAITENKVGTTAKSTAVGAGVGALAGGSKGAKIGAAAGLGLSALGGGKSINIPMGTLLEFTLDSDFTCER